MTCVVRCFIEATLKHSKAPGAVRASKKRYRLLPKGAKAEGRRIRRGKLRKAKAEALKRGLVARSCARSGRKDVVGEVKGIEMMGVLGAGRGARERGGRRLEVEVNSKRRSPGHDVSNLVLETVEESCAFGEDIVLVGLR